MSDPVRCKVCNGRRVIQKMGGMTGKCSECDGIGWVSLSISTPHDDSLIVPRETTPLTQPKKRGRPAKAA